jgi:hypothetical protein
MRLHLLLFILATAVGCGSSKDQGSEQTAGDPKLDSEGLPPECGEFKAVVDKIQACEQLPRDLRDNIKHAYDTDHASWMRTSARGRAGLGIACKVGRDTYLTAEIKQTCKL